MFVRRCCSRSKNGATAKYVQSLKHHQLECIFSVLHHGIDAFSLSAVVVIGMRRGKTLKICAACVERGMSYMYDELGPWDCARKVFDKITNPYWATCLTNLST